MSDLLACQSSEVKYLAFDPGEVKLSAGGHHAHGEGGLN